jgi:hypothetical protein
MQTRIGLRAIAAYCGAQCSSRTDSYLNEALIATTLLESLMPTPLTAVIIAIAIPAAIRRIRSNPLWIDRNNQRPAHVNMAEMRALQLAHH